MADTPPLTVTKTVGTDPDVCATTSEIQVAIGTPVNYCYKVVNNTGYTFAIHNVVDDKLGPILTNFNFSLVPGGSAFVMTSQLPVGQPPVGMTTITADVTNTVTWTVRTAGLVPTGVGALAAVPPPIEFSATDTATVTVADTPPLTVTKTVGTDPAVCATTSEIQVAIGTPVNYCYKVVNNTGYTFTVHNVVDDKLGPILTNFNFSLVPGGSAFVMTSQLPVGMTTINADVTNTVMWTVRTAGLVPAGVGALAAVPPPIEFSGTDTATVRVIAPTTTAAPTTVAPSTTAVDGLPPIGELPGTGSDSSATTTVVALGVLLSGMLLAFLSRRRSEAPS